MLQPLLPDRRAQHVAQQRLSPRRIERPGSSMAAAGLTLYAIDRGGREGNPVHAGLAHESPGKWLMLQAGTEAGWVSVVELFDRHGRSGHRHCEATATVAKILNGAHWAFNGADLAWDPSWAIRH